MEFREEMAKTPEEMRFDKMDPKQESPILVNAIKEARGDTDGAVDILLAKVNQDSRNKDLVAALYRALVKREEPAGSSKTIH